MNRFKPSSFEVKQEPEKDQETRVIKLEAPVQSVITSFNLSKIKKLGEGDYKSVRAKYGALAATDADRAARSRKDSRFTLSPLLRDPLSVEEEERRAIEEKVRARVAAVAGEAKSEAASLGYKDGLKKGFEEAYKKFREEGNDRVRKFDEFLTECESAKESIYKANERAITEIIFRVARMILLRELTTDREYVLRVSRELIERVGVRENITIRIHPDEMATAGKLKEDLEKALGTLKNLNIEGSSQVKRGGCMVETEWNAIDASVETQLQGIYEALVGGRSES